MKKFVISKAVKIGILSSLASVLLTAAVILLTGLKNITTKDGIYAVRSGKMIELKGNAELKLYNTALEYMGNFPSGRKLYISSDYSHFIKGAKLADLMYHNGVLDGDFYEVNVSLIKTRDEALLFDSLYCKTGALSEPRELSFSKREDLVRMATEGMLDKIK